MRDLIIVGAGGFGREIAALVEAINAASSTWNLRGFVDDDATLHETSLLGYPVLGSLDWLADRDSMHASIAVGTSAVRCTLSCRLQNLTRPVTLIHPDVSIHRTVHVGAGSIVCQGCTPTVDIQIGTHTIVNLHCTIGHEVQIGDYVTLHPGVHLSGACIVEEQVELGTGAVVLPGVTIGQGAIVGAGAVVNRDVPPGCTAVGVPARPIDRQR